MAKTRKSRTRPFDISTKELLELGPQDWLACAGLDGGKSAKVVDADVSTVATMADRVIRVEDIEAWLAHFEFAAGYEPRIGRKMLRYNVLLDYRHDLPVESVLVLQRPKADGPAITGQVIRKCRGRSRHLVFKYHVIRLWEMSVATFLQGGLATLPLAPLAKVTQDEVPDVIGKMKDRIDQEASPSHAGMLWEATYLLMGLRYPHEFAVEVLQGVRNMFMNLDQSVTYQKILSEGEIKGKSDEAKAILLRLGKRRFGKLPGRRANAAINKIADLSLLEDLAERVYETNSWDELLQNAK